MKHRHAYGAFVTLLVLLSSLWAQNPPQHVRTGVVRDWTQQQIVYSRAALLKKPSLVDREPRIMNREMQHLRNSFPRVFEVGSSSPNVRRHRRPRRPHRDWNFDLGLGRLALNAFPSKFSFDLGADPDCVNDYVVFGLGRVGADNGQANLVAFNNLYSGTTPDALCGLTDPTVLFAYNISTVTAGRITTSPALSLDGTKIAFVESGNILGVSTSIFHVLTWIAGDGATLDDVTHAANGSLVMTSLPFSAALDTRSSIWVDYNTDTAYVGADDGILYKILNVFNGVPTLAISPWPVTLGSDRLSSPVLDKNLGLVMVGDQSGTFFSVDATTAAVKAIVIGSGTNPGILAPAIVDVTNGTSFVVSSNDGTSGVLVEVDSASMSVLATGRIGLASKSGTVVNLFQPAFSDSYFNDPSTGVARLCGTDALAINPWQYSFGFTGNVMNATPVFSQQLLASTAARCTGWTEFFNPNVAGGTDFFFFGLSADCTGPATSGCVAVRTGDDLVAPVTANIAGGPRGIVVDNDSIEDQASSIYFTGAVAPNTAYKLTQNGLN